VPNYLGVTQGGGEISIIQKKSSFKKLNDWSLDKPQDSKSDRKFNSIRREHNVLLHK